jgi:hypothetical protein
MAKRGKRVEPRTRFFDPRPPLSPPRKANIRLVEHDGPEIDVDPMVDYIEGAEWWLARSDNSVSQLRKMFDKQEVAICLYEVVGATLEVTQRDGYYVIQIQVMHNGRDDWMSDVALEEAGIYLDERIET